MEICGQLVMNTLPRSIGIQGSVKGTRHEASICGAIFSNFGAYFVRHLRMCILRTDI